MVYRCDCWMYGISRPQKFGHVYVGKCIGDFYNGDPMYFIAHEGNTNPV